MGKPGPALFELIREPGNAKGTMARPGMPITPARSALAGSGSSPAPMPGPAPLPKPRVRLATVTTAAAVAPSMPAAEAEPKPEPSRAPKFPQASGGFKLRQPLKVTMSGAMLAGAGALVLVIVVATAVYTLGFKDGQTKVLTDRGLGHVTVTDPLKAEQVPLNTGLVIQETAHTPPASKAPTPRQTPQPPSPAAPAAGEFVAGLNYCIAASRLDKEAAERAAGFLTQNGLPAAAVVEGWGQASKNGGLYRVVVLKGITGKEYGSRAPARTEVESQLAKLGQAYKKDPKGRLDFGQPSWEKKKE